MFCKRMAMPVDQLIVPGFSPVLCNACPKLNFHFRKLRLDIV